jgi:hypothetical protein
MYFATITGKQFVANVAPYDLWIYSSAVCLESISLRSRFSEKDDVFINICKCPRKVLITFVRF